MSKGFPMLPQAARAIERLRAAGHEAWIVGGCVRDVLLGRTPTDYDLTTSALPEETEAVFAGERLIETGLQHGTVTVLLEGVPLEITTYRVDGGYTDARHPDGVTFTRSLREDAARRDFTINAMAYAPGEGLQDFFGGQADLSAGVIRAVGEPDRRFQEDALRILRAIRFASVLGFELDPETDAAAMIAQTRADLQREIERQTGPKGIDLSWWQSHYNDIIGYVYSPGTPISYPIAYDGNNEYYLHHDLYGNYSEYGTIFLDARVPSDFSGHNNVLYGHHMSDGSMFASISNYKQQWYYDAHPYFFLYTNAGKYRVDLFAGIVVPGTHEVFSTSLSADQLQRFINNSTFYSGKGVPSGQIVTLCTCSYEAANYRYVVLGELVKLEDAPADTATEAAA